MRKFILFLSFMLVMAGTMVSCLDSDDGKITLELIYQGKLEQIDYVAQKDTTYSFLVESALEDMGLIGAKSQFFEKIKSKNAIEMELVPALNANALDTYRQKFNDITLSDVKKAAFRLMPDSMVVSGKYPNFEAMPIHHFTGTFRLINTYGPVVGEGSSVVKQFL